MSSKQTKINFGSNRNKPKQDLFRVCFSLFRETKKKKFWCFGVSNLYRNNRNKQICFVTNRNSPKFSEKFPNVLSFKLFGWVFCLLRFNRNYLFWYRSETTETNCFETNRKNRKKLKNEKTKKTEKNEKKLKNPKFSEKITKYAPN